MSKKYEHLFFDLDHTLWDFQTNSRHAIEELLDSLLAGHEMTKEAFFEAYVDVNKYYWAQYRDGKIKKDKLRYIRFHKTLTQFGIDNKDLAVKMGQGYVEISPYKKALIDGTIEVLDYLKSKNYSMHIITNGFKEVQHIKLRESGLDKYMDEVIISETAGAKKPSFRVFEYAFNRTNTFAEESAMIGDDLQADILGARNVGMDQFYYNPSQMKHDYKITHEIQSLTQLIDIL